MRTLQRVGRAECASFILDVHYAKRWPSISYAFGLFIDGVMEGVVTYGTPPSAPLRSGIAGPDYKGVVIELNRLVLLGNRKNDASWLVSRSLKELKGIGNFIVVSFADTAQGHTGIVYQASGFRYHGLSAKRTDWKIAGQEHLHGQTIADRYRGAPDRAKAIRAEWGDKFYLSPRPRKHRYIKVVGTRGFRAAATRSIRYAEEGFP